MADTTHSSFFSLYGDRAASVADAVGGRLGRLARRVNHAFYVQERRDVDREIERLIAQSGGRLTDSVEREIAQTVMSSDWGLPH